MTTERLRDIPSLMQWLAWQGARPNPVLDPKHKDSLVRVVAAADKALASGSNPPAYFAVIIGKNKKLTVDEMKAARKKLDSLSMALR